MKWLLHLYRFWPLYLAGAIAITGVGLWAHHSIYESGRADEKAVWKLKFDAAARELVAANARTKAKEMESSRAVAESQRRIDETQKTLDIRSADYDQRLRALSVRYTAAARRCDLPKAPGTSPVPDAATASVERAERAGASFADIGKRAEWDSARLAQCVRIYTEQRAIINR